MGEIFLLIECWLLDSEINNANDATKKPDIKVSAQTFLYSKPTPIIKKTMSGISRSEHHIFSVPLIVDINSGSNWGEVR